MVVVAWDMRINNHMVVVVATSLVRIQIGEDLGALLHGDEDLGALLHGGEDLRALLQGCEDFGALLHDADYQQTGSPVWLMFQGSTCLSTDVKFKFQYFTPHSVVRLERGSKLLHSHC